MYRGLILLVLLSLAACQPQQQRIPRPINTEAKERQDQPQEASDFYVRKRAPQGETVLDYALYEQARQQAQGLPLYSSRLGQYVDPGSRAAFVNWTFLGPGNIGGRTRQIVIDPANTNIIYLAAVAGGVWKSTDAGASWQALDDLMANLAVSSLVMDPANSQVLYAGTGEGFFNVDSVRGAGIFKTTNGGATWTQLASTNGSDFNYVNDLKISQWNSNRVYAATNSGLFRSTDGGSSWSAMTLDNGSIQRVGRCTQLQLRTDLANQDVLFASCFSSNNDHVIWRSTNAQAASPGWDAVLAPTSMDRASMALAPSNQDILYVLASHDGSFNANYQNGLLAVYRTIDGGDSWQTRVDNSNGNNLVNGISLNTLQLTNPVVAACSVSHNFYNQGWYDNVIAVDPVNPNRVWTGGIDLLVSDDGGANWGIASYWWINPRDGGINSDSPHADQHAIVFDPNYDGVNNKKLYVANDGGIYRAADATASPTSDPTEVCASTYGDVFWIEQFGWSILNNSYGVTQFYDGEAFPDGSSYFAGAQDNGTLMGNDTDGANAWIEIRGGDGGYVSMDPNNTNVLYSSYTGLSLQKSTDGGSNWTDAVTGIDTALDTSFLFITPHAMNPSDANNLWIGGSYLWRTTDGAASWVQASTDNGASMSAVAVSPVNGNAVLAGLTNGKVLYQTAALTADSTTIWPSVTLQNGCWISSVRLAPGSDQVAYATSSTFGCGHVFQTVNGGSSWSDISNDLPDIPAHDVMVDPDHANRLFLATDLGMFVSVNGGANWAQENSGFANVVVESLDMENISGQNVLFAFTHGRGVWKTPLSNANNSAPVISDPDGNDDGQTAVVMDEDGNPTAFALAQLSASDADLDPLSWSIFSAASNGAASVDGSGNVGYSPAADYNGADSFTVQVSDGQGGTDNLVIHVTINAINDAPVISDPDGNDDGQTSVIMDEDGSPTAFVLAQLSATDVDMNPLSWTVSSAASNGTASVDTSGNASYAPNADYNGADSFTVQVNDGQGGSDNLTVNVTVNPINDLPTYTSGGNVVVPDTQGSYSAIWASNVSVGPADESTQTASFTANNDNNALFSVQPTLDASGVLNFSVSGQLGVATVSVSLSDGIDSTAVETFTIEVQRGERVFKDSFESP